MRVPSRFVQKFIQIASIALLTCTPLSLGLSISSVLFSTPAAAQVEPVTVEFRTALEPYGAFYRVARWGEVWVPNVATDWRPYTMGRWVYSGDFGWYWVSDAPEAPWGWVVFHYGRWVWIDDMGWAWVPGRQWGPAWVNWRRGDGYIGWAPLPPEDLVVDIRDEPQYWIFCRPADFLATNIATVFVEPQPVLLRETVVVNQSIVVRDRGFAVNPGIEPGYIAAFVGRPIPEYQVRPHVLAGTVSLPNAIEVTGEDLRSGDFRQDLVRQTNIRQTSNAIEPARNVPSPQPLGPNERGRLGDNPPRAASGLAQQLQRQPSTVGQAPQQQRRGFERGLGEQGPMGNSQQQRNLRERGVTGSTRPEQQRGLNQGGASQQQRGYTERGANGFGQEQRLYNRGETGQPNGPRERGTTRAMPNPQQRGFTERGPTATGSGQQRQLFNRGDTGFPSGGQRGTQGRGAFGSTPEQRSLREQGASGQRGFGAEPGGSGLRERGAMGPSSGQERQLFNRAPAAPMTGPQRGMGDRGFGGGAGSGGGRQQRGFDRGH